MIDGETQQRARRAQNRRLALVSALLAVTFVGFAVVEVRRRGASLAVFAVLAFPVVLTVLMVGLVLLLRHRGVYALQPAASAGLDRHHRKALLRAVRSGRHLQGQDEALALDTARRLAGTRWMLWWAPLMAALFAAQAIGRGLSGLGGLSLLAAVAVLAALPLAWRDVRAARRYLAGPPRPLREDDPAGRA